MTDTKFKPQPMQTIVEMVGDPCDGFLEYSDEQLREVEEMRLRSRMARIAQESKRITVELQRRADAIADANGTPRNLVPPAEVIERERAAAKLSVAELEAKRIKEQEKEAKKQATIAASMALLAEAIKQGNFNKVQQAIKKAGK